MCNLVGVSARRMCSGGCCATYRACSVPSVHCRRSLQQTTVRDATQHGNTLQRRRQCGEGGVMRFSAKASIIKVNCKNPPESGRGSCEEPPRPLKLRGTPRNPLVFIERKVQVANFTAHSSEEAWHATRPASCAPIL